MATTTHSAPPRGSRPQDGGRPVAITTETATGDETRSAALHTVRETARLLEAVQDELPRRSWPVLLGATGLVLTGVLEVPTAAGLSVLYLVARHWPFPRRTGIGGTS